MLRISEIHTTKDHVTLLLEGQISSASTTIVREATENLLTQGCQVTLDLSGVLFADRSGIALLRELQQRQVALIHGSPFLKEQLKAPTAS